MRFRLDISYKGTAYQGWQKQPGRPTVQGVLEEALSVLLRAQVETTGCGRTDSGVHAHFFPLHFDYAYELPQHFLYRLNGMLPADVAALRYTKVPDEFHARFDAVSRTYRYYLHFLKDPFHRETSWLQHKKPDLLLLNEAAAMLTGVQNCKSFTKGEEPAHHGYECLIYKAAWLEEHEQLIFHIQANRFLRNMVRALVGSLLEVGYGNKPVSWFQGLLEGGSRSDAGQSVPAHGLFLEHVGYPDAG